MFFAALAVAAAVSGTPSPQAVIGNPYYMADSQGAVWALGGAADHGSLLGDHLNAPIVGITVTPDKGGYWLVASDGGVFAFGDAGYYGSTGNMHLNKPIIGMASTVDGHGYWLYAADGGIFAFGDAGFYGSTGNIHLNKPIIGMAPTADKHGYWLYAPDGGVFAFGDAGFYGSTGNIRLNQPIVSMAASPGGHGYWLVASDGGIFNFGDAPFDGALSATGAPSPVQAMIADPAGGYWEITHDAGVYGFGAANGVEPPEFGMMHTILTAGDTAMEWAMAQMGKPYQWGGAGPGSFDCSGLVMRAWQAAGVNIPRVAADQYGAGPHVAIDDLHIGDLVFWATNTADPTTIYHVAMYIGGDHMVEAPHTGAVVSINWIGGSDFVSLGTRP